MTQRATATELAVSERHIRRLVSKLVTGGDKSAIHGLKGKPSNRAIGKQTKDKAIEILSREIYNDFGPTFAVEELAKRHQIQASKETVRKWMAEAKLRRPKQAKVGTIHVWRPRRSCYGEFTGTHRLSCPSACTPRNRTFLLCPDTTTPRPHPALQT